MVDRLSYSQLFPTDPNLRHVYFTTGTGHLHVGSTAEYYTFVNHKMMLVA